MVTAGIALFVVAVLAIRRVFRNIVKGEQVPWLPSPSLLLWPLLYAGFLELEIVPLVTRNPYTGLLDHLIVALMISSMLGLTYEYFLSRRREKEIGELIDNRVTALGRDVETKVGTLKTRLDETLELYAATKPGMVLRLLRDVVAAQTKQIPTLYRPARDTQSEYTFAANLRYFDLVIALRRTEVLDILREWLLDPLSPPSVKFLATDLIGRYALYELVPVLRKEVTVQLSRWPDVDQECKSWVLNCIWASACCDSPKYRGLTEFMCSQADDFDQKWILFVPFQMPESELGDMIFAYLQSPKVISRSNLENTLRALSVLNAESVCDAKSILLRNVNRFQEQSLIDLVKQLFGLDLAAKPL